MKKNEVINKVNESLGSLFTKDDVIKVIELLDEGAAQDGAKYTAHQVDIIVETLINDIKDNIHNLDADDIVNENDLDLGLSGREIVIDSIDVQFDVILNAVNKAVNDFDIESFEFKQ